MKLKITLIIAILFVGLSINAQTKVGTVDVEYIITKMPQLKAAQDRINKYAARLDSTYNKNLKNYQGKVDAYNNSLKTLSEADKKSKYGELSDLDQSLSKFRQNGAKLMQIKKDDVLRPLYKRISEVVQVVAKEKRYTQVLTTKGNQFAYFDSKFDITKLVLAKMGIKE